MIARRARPSGLALGALAAVLAIAALGLEVRPPGLVSEVRAGETELPATPVDSVELEPGLPAVPPVPAAPEVPGEPRTRVIHRIRGVNIEGGKNDVVQMGQDIVIGPGQHVLGKVLAVGGSITVHGVVDDDVVALGGDVIVEPGAQIRGDAVSVGGSVLRDPAGTILGSTVSVAHVPRTLFTWGALNFMGHGIQFVQHVTSLLLWIFVAWILVAITRARSSRVLGRIEAEPLGSIGWGLLGVIGVVPATVTVALASALLCVTIIGIPVALLLLLGYIVALGVLFLWGMVMGTAAIGGWFVRRLAPRLGEPSLVRNTLWGVVAVAGPGVVAQLFHAVAVAVPPAALLGDALQFVGCLLKIGAVMAGIGGVLLARAGQPAPLPGALAGGPPAVASPPISPPVPPAPAGPEATPA